MVGSDVFICYKKSMNRPPLLCYKPSILNRFPLEDYPHYSLPESVSLFCFPMGATIECWPKSAQQPKPIFSTFVLTSDSAEKVYGTAITFYEKLNKINLKEEELKHLSYTTVEDRNTKLLHRIKSICILSKWPFFDTFEKYLLFLHKTIISTEKTPQKIPIERYISHFMLEIPFPSPQRPKILVQLGANTEETVLISQPPEYMPLALNGASFTQMLRNLGPENCLHVLLFALTEQKILLHSLRPDVLTSVAEAVVTMIFPFHWQCPYIPMCPLGLCDVLNAPLPFIVGVDSRYFDHFEPPIDVASVDLDTNSIYLSENKRLLNPKLLPKKPTRILKNTLERLFERLIRPISATNGAYNSQNLKIKSTPFNDNFKAKKFERQIEIEIQEAFIRFMASVLRNFRSYLLPITRAPTVGATDPSSLFDLFGFLKSRDKNYHKFYSLIMRTQMFTRFIEERSFVSDKNISLAFFDECSEKLESMGDSVDSSSSLRLLDINDYVHNDQTVFIPPPEPISPEDEYTYHQFGPLDPHLYHKQPSIITLSRISSLLNESETGISENSSLITPSSPMSKRTKQEIRTAQKFAKRHADSPMTWTKCLLSYCYSLWFIHLPAYVKVNSLMKGNPLNVAFQVLLRMQSLNFHPPDEVCYRIMMLLCGIYSQPVLAVKVLFEMKANNVTPNAITYGYYNKAVLESKWPTGDTTATLMWNKLRNVIVGVAQFRKSGRIRSSKLNYLMTETDNQNSLKNDSKMDEHNCVDTTDCAHTKYSESVCSANSICSEPHSTICRTVKFDETVDFRESDAFRERTRSIVRKSTSSLRCLNDFNSSAGVLMTSHLSNFTSNGFDCDENYLKRRHKSADQGGLKVSELNIDETHLMSLNSHKPYLRSYSFGNDAKIIQKLKHETLKELRQQLNNEDIKQLLVKEKELDISKRISSSGNAINCVKTIGGLSRCNEDPEEEDEVEDGEEEVMKNWQKNMIASNIANKSDNKSTNFSNRESSVTSTNSRLTNESSETINSNQSSENSDELSKNVNHSDVMSSFSPFKDAIMNLDIFSSEGKVASTLRSSFRIASRFAKSASPVKSGISRSTTFHDSSHSNSDKALNKIGSLFRRDLQKVDSESGTPMKTMSRSATLPPVSPSKISENIANNEKLLKLEKHETDSSQEEFTNEEVIKDNEILSNLSSQWTNKLAANKHSEYVYSTIKSAANNMANRFSGLKSSLASSSSSASNSPSKLMNNSNTSGVANVASGTASLISQWASIVAEKFPSNFVFDDDDCSSNNSLDMRRSSFAASEDEMSERSRDGSLGRNFTGFGMNSSSSPMFELLEQYYSTNLEPTINSFEIFMEIEMTSCSRCYSCLSLIYDEEIMEGWTADDSNLNTNCTFCGSKFVPLLTITIKDLRNDDSEDSTILRGDSREHFDNKIKNNSDSDKKSENLNHMTSDDNSFDEVDGHNHQQECHQILTINQENNISLTLKERQSPRLLLNSETSEPITVPFLSPLVLRKEVENVLNNEGDLCLAKPEFVDEHPIIYWNLIWFFKRINLPSHLQGLCLSAATFNKENKNKEKWKSLDYRNVSVRCMWDNEKLREDIGSPLHHLWLESSLRSPLLHALVTDERKLTRGLLRQIIESIQCNNLSTPMKLLITERLKLNAIKNNVKKHSIYRELLFLSFVALGRENINHTSFDREYRRAYESMTPKDQLGLSSIDKPPSIGAVFCRRFFKELELRSQTTQTINKVLNTNNSIQK